MSDVRCRHRNEDSVSDVLSNAKVNVNSGFEPEPEPHLDFRQALAPSGALRSMGAGARDKTAMYLKNAHQRYETGYEPRKYSEPRYSRG